MIWMPLSQIVPSDKVITAHLCALPYGGVRHPPQHAAKSYLDDITPTAGNLGNHMAQEADKVIIGGGQTVLGHRLSPDANKVAPTLSWSGPRRSLARGGKTLGYLRLVTSIWSVQLPSRPKFNRVLVKPEG